MSTTETPLFRHVNLVTGTRSGIGRATAMVCARAAVWAASDAFDYMIGTTLVIDGGMMM